MNQLGVYMFVAGLLLLSSLKILRRLFPTVRQHYWKVFGIGVALIFSGVFVGTSFR